TAKRPDVPHAIGSQSRKARPPVDGVAPPLQGFLHAGTGREAMRRLAFRLPLVTCLLGLGVAAALAHHARGDAVSDFYRGKTVTIIVGYSAGGGYDLYARALGRHMGRHLPGNPGFIVQNITGAGSLNAANHLYNVSAKDGTAFGTFGRGLP